MNGTRLSNFLTVKSRVAIIFIVSIAMVPVASPASPSAGSVVAQGGPGITGVLWATLDGSFKYQIDFVAVQDGFSKTLDLEQPRVGAWYEAAVLPRSGSARPARFGGPLQSSQIRLSAGSGGHMSIPLGAFGTAQIDLNPVQAYGLDIGGPDPASYLAYPVTCIPIGYSEPGFSWNSYTVLRAALVMDAQGSLGDYRLQATDPTQSRPKIFNYLFLGSESISHVGYSSDGTITPTFAIGLGCP